MRILSIETSCDETAAALLEFTQKNGDIAVNIVAEKLHSQTDIHAEYGGVFPTLAKREHQKILPLLVKNMLKETGTLQSDTAKSITKDIETICEREPDMLSMIRDNFEKTRIEDIDAIAVTRGPGLAPALWVGVNFARAIATLWQIPVIPVNHMEGHIFSALFNTSGTCSKPQYPVLSLLVSGGHTELVLSPKEGEYKKIGNTLDDAAGEAFDKVARLLGLPYPGGPEIGKIAHTAREQNLAAPVTLPRPMLKDSSLNFSYAGLKTAVRVYLEKNPRLSEDETMALAMEFEDAVVETLLEKTRRSIEIHNPKTIVVGGGVSANKHLREKMTEMINMYPETTLHLSELKHATDNAVMIALAAYIHRNEKTDALSLSADSGLSFPMMQHTN